MNVATDEGFIAYLVLVRLDKGADLRDRIEESAAALRDTLAEIGEVLPAMTSYDGSAAAYLVAAPPDLQPWQVTEQLQSPRSKRASPLQTLDKVLVLSIGLGVAHRMERVNDWLRDHDSLA